MPLPLLGVLLSLRMEDICGVVLLAPDSLASTLCTSTPLVVPSGLGIPLLTPFAEMCLDWGDLSIDLDLKPEVLRLKSLVGDLGLSGVACGDVDFPRSFRFRDASEEVELLRDSE